MEAPEHLFPCSPLWRQWQQIGPCRIPSGGSQAPSKGRGDKKVYVGIFLSVPVESPARGVVPVCSSAAVCPRALLLTCFAGCQGRVLGGSHNRKATHTPRPLPASPS